jgi:hypothetical protein
VREKSKSLMPVVTLLVVLAFSAAARELVLVSPGHVSAHTISEWKADQFTGVVLLLHATNAAAVARAAGQLELAALPYYYWIEVGRDEGIAKQHPRWMASLGMHEDWQQRFPKTAEPKIGEVAKAYPWVPINYQEAFDAHLARVKELLARVPTNYAGVLLNHLQSGPSSCGCGNLQCRWATDYQVPSTGTYSGEGAAGRFVRAIQALAGSPPVIPIWTTECDEEDLPASKRPNGKSTGLCGTVGCATGACPMEFTKQWNHLVKNHDGAIALLALHNQLGRTNAAFAHGPGWVDRPVAYLDETLPKNGGSLFPHDRLWLVVEGRTREEESAARKAAAGTGSAGVVVARIALDQSFAPRLIGR